VNGAKRADITGKYVRVLLVVKEVSGGSERRIAPNRTTGGAVPEFGRERRCANQSRSRQREARLKSRREADAG
jgi:hypothetical protein